MRAFVLLAAVVAAGGLSERAVGAERKEFSVWNVFTGDPNREVRCCSCPGYLLCLRCNSQAGLCCRSNVKAV